MQHITKPIRPLPYWNCPTSLSERVLASALRRDFVGKVSRALPLHHLKGFRAGEIVNTVSRLKKSHPFFLRLDIEKFYPSIRHQDVVVYSQVAYRDLLHMDFVPRSFKERYVRPINEWCRSLPLERGIPLGSPLSAILSAILLVPLWLSVKREFGVPFIVFADDILIFCKDEHQCSRIYAHLHNRLQTDYDLRINISKCHSGRFSQTAVDFCGWRFVGGYATICPAKVEEFKIRYVAEVNRSLKQSLKILLKRVNRKTDGFANYYKHGNVGKQFEELDKFIRKTVREALKSYGKSSATNANLKSYGLHSLGIAYHLLHERSNVKKRVLKQPKPPRHLQVAGKGAMESRLTEAVEKLNTQLTQIIAQQRKQTHLLTQLLQSW